MRKGKDPNATKQIWRRCLVGIAILALGTWLFLHGREVETVARTISRGRLQWIVPATIAECGVTLLMTLDYRQSFEAVNVSLPFGGILRAILASLVVGEVAPFGWAAGGAVYLRLAKKYRQPEARAAVGVLVAQTADLATFSVLFVLGMLTLFLTGHRMSGSEKAGAAVLVAMNFGLIGALTLTIGWPSLIERWQSTLDDNRSRFQSRRWIQKIAEAVRGLLKSLIASGQAIREKPTSVIAALAAAGAANLFYVLCLFFVFLSYRQPVTIGELLAGFCVGQVAWIVSPVPGGIGVVEGAMALTLVSLGIPAPHATAIAIAYRGVSFWLPFIAGLFFLRQIGTRPNGSAGK